MPVQTTIRTRVRYPPNMEPAQVRGVIRDAMAPVARSIRRDTPVRTGRLRDSTRVLASRRRVSVGWDTPYAPFVEARTGVIASHAEQVEAAAIAAVEELAEQQAVIARIRGARRRG